MNNKKITIGYIIKQWRFIITLGLVFALITFIVSAILPAKYQSDISVLVVQEQASEKVDAFSATKSAEFLSGIFARVIYTTTFFNAVADAPFDVRRDFSHDPEKREKEWKKFINVKKVNNTGIIHISVVDESRKTAEETAKAVAYILTTKGEEYHGGGERVTVRLIDGPNTPLCPTIPRILPNTTVGALFGFMMAVVFLYFFPDELQSFVRRRTTKEDITLSVSGEDIHEEYEDKVDTNIVDKHFKNTQGTIAFERNEENIIEKEHSGDAEVSALHEKISNFHKNN